MFACQVAESDLLHRSRTSVPPSVASSVDFLMSDGDDDASFLSLPTATFSQHSLLTAALSESNAPNQPLLIQVIKDGRHHVTTSTSPKD